MFDREPLRPKSLLFLPLRPARDVEGGPRGLAQHLLKEETCAAEAYQHALMAEGLLASRKEDLRRLLDDHLVVVRKLRGFVKEAEFPSGVRSVWAELTWALDREARVSAGRSVLWTLRDAEILAAQEYRGYLDRGVLPSNCVDLVRTRLIPQAQNHVRVLEGLIALAEEEARTAT